MNTVPPNRLVRSLVLCAALVIVDGSLAADKAAPVAAAAGAAADAASEAAAWRDYNAKRALVHPSAPDAVAQRTANFVATLPGITAPAVATAGSFNDGGAMVSYVRRQHAPPRLLGTVVFIDDRERVPGAAPLFAVIAEVLARRGWDTWTIALADVTPAAPLPHERRHVVMPATMPATMKTAEADAPVKPDVTAKTATASNASAGRRRWTSPAKLRVPVPDPAARWRSWQTAANQRIATLIKTAQPSDSSNPPPPLVVIGSGLAAALVAQQVAAGQGQAQSTEAPGAAQSLPADALVLIDLLLPPSELAISLDGSIAALQLPTLAMAWQKDDPITPGVWLRLPQAAHRDLSHAPPEQLARNVRGWLDRIFHFAPGLVF